jgi:hypothetical protein
MDENQIRQHVIERYKLAFTNQSNGPVIQILGGAFLAAVGFFFGSAGTRK